jgi:DNA-directed RNA polymerase subunit RPC12/RpoP
MKCIKCGKKALTLVANVGWICRDCNQKRTAVPKTHTFNIK